MQPPPGVDPAFEAMKKQFAELQSIVKGGGKGQPPNNKGPWSNFRGSSKSSGKGAQRGRLVKALEKGALHPYH